MHVCGNVHLSQQVVAGRSADTDVVVRKGTVKGVDSYSGFGDAFEGKWEKTELCEVLTKAGIKEVGCGVHVRCSEASLHTPSLFRMSVDSGTQIMRQVYCVGLATDFCVSFTAKDAKKNGRFSPRRVWCAVLRCCASDRHTTLCVSCTGFETTVVVDGARGISEEGIAKEREQWATLGVKTCDAADVE